MASSHLFTLAIIGLAVAYVLKYNYDVDSSFTLLYLQIEASLLLSTQLYYRLIRPNFFSPLLKYPQAPGMNPLWGQFIRIFSEPLGMPMRDWQEQIPNSGWIAYRSIFNHERLMPTSAEAIRAVVSNKHYEMVKPDWIKRMLRRVLGEGLLHFDGEEHRQMRRVLMPAFSIRHVRDLFPMFLRTSRNMIKLIDAEIPENNVVDMAEWLNRATLDIIGQAAIGRPFYALEDPTNALFDIYTRVVNPTRIQLALDLLAPVIPYQILQRLPFARNRELDEATRELHKHCEKIVEEHMKRRADGLIDDSDTTILNVAVKSDYFSQKGLVHQMMSFIAAGHETTSNAVTWTLLFLAQNPDVLSQLRAVLATLGNIRDHGAKVTYDQLDKLAYLQAVCHESLRFMPPIPTTIRVSKHDEVVGSIVVPANVYVVLSMNAINHNKASPRYSSRSCPSINTVLQQELWGEDADEFKPSRWLSETGEFIKAAGAARDSIGFMSFLAGPRSCIAQHMAQMEMACLVASIVQAYDFELVDPTRKVVQVTSVTQKLGGGLPLRMSRRT